jgi:triacylglycerol esterase/lipase EstA (alpha/beta hydrolase family)
MRRIIAEYARGMRARPTVVVLAITALAAATAAPAAAADFASPDTPGPALSVAQKDLDAALQCSPGLDNAARAPVLLVQGTGATAKDNWSWTYEPALDKLHIAWCAVDLPDHATGDVQRNGEYVVNAIRTMHTRAGRPIAIIGHSQGGMVPRWALRFWPDTRAMVDDVIGFAPSNHGTTQAGGACGDGACPAADWQQSDHSNFMRALNSVPETFSGISYTSIYTHTDEVVFPNADSTGSSSLHGGGGAITNVAIQDLCPMDLNEHLGIGTYDAPAYALAMDALSHDGAADPARVDRGVCQQPLMPGVTPRTFPTSYAATGLSLGNTLLSAKHVSAEPPLACYVTASCPEAVAPATSAATGKAKRAHKPKAKHKRRHARRRHR